MSRTAPDAPAVGTHPAHARRPRAASPGASLAKIAVMAALIAVMGAMPGIPVPGIPAPITLQTLGVMLAGLVLGPWRGAACLALIGALPHVWAVVVFGFLAFAIGWSWPGLFLFAVARVGRDSPTQASSVIQAGAFVGGALGPALFGLVVSAVGFEVSWYVASFAFLVAAALVLAARHGFRLDLRNRPPAQPFGYGGGHDAPRFTTDPPL